MIRLQLVWIVLYANFPPPLPISNNEAVNRMNVLQGFSQLVPNKPKTLALGKLIFRAAATTPIFQLLFKHFVDARPTIFSN